MSERSVKLYPTLLVVEGKAPFPIDMLRYDNCVPCHEVDTGWIQEASYQSQETRRIELHRYTYEKRRPATSARWESFAWRVVEEKSL